MAIIRVAKQQREIHDAQQIREFLEQHGIWFEQWDVAGRIGPEASNEEILAAYAPEIEQLKQRGGYATADVINVTADTPGLDEMLNKFNKEHTHSEDEVRFTVSGRGLFHIHPANGEVFSIEVETGDLINVPAGTQHWFDLCSNRSIRCIRLFKDTSGWSPAYIEGGVHGNYIPVCMGPAFIPQSARIESIISP